MSEPIEVTPGVYTKPGGSKVTGLCLMLDNQDGQWELTTTDNYTTVITIKKHAKWNAQDYTDPKTGKRKVQIFCEGATLMGLKEDFNEPTIGDPNSTGPGVKIFISTPND